MKTMIQYFAAMMIMLSALFSASCDDGGGDDTGNPASSLFVSKSVLPAGEICEAGGVQIDMGFDVNRNNVLDADEITNTEYICNGTDTSSHPYPVYTSPSNNDTGVNVGSVISVVFNTDMDASTITTGAGGTFVVRDSGNNIVCQHRY